MPYAIPANAATGTIESIAAMQANALSLDFALTSPATFTGQDALHLELRKIGVLGADGLLARSTQLLPTNQTQTLAFTSAQMNQAVAGDRRDYSLTLYGVDGLTHKTYWQATLELYADEAASSSSEDPPTVPVSQRYAIVTLLAGENQITLTGDDIPGADEIILNVAPVLDVGIIYQGMDSVTADTLNFTGAPTSDATFIVTITPL